MYMDDEWFVQIRLDMDEQRCGGSSNSSGSGPGGSGSPSRSRSTCGRRSSKSQGGTEGWLVKGWLRGLAQFPSISLARAQRAAGAFRARRRPMTQTAMSSYRIAAPLWQSLYHPFDSRYAQQFNVMFMMLIWCQDLQNSLFDMNIYIEMMKRPWYEKVSKR